MAETFEQARWRERVQRICASGADTQTLRIATGQDTAMPADLAGEPGR